MIQPGPRTWTILSSLCDPNLSNPRNCSHWTKTELEVDKNRTGSDRSGCSKVRASLQVAQYKSMWKALRAARVLSCALTLFPAIATLAVAHQSLPDSVEFEGAIRGAETTPRIKSLLISRNGELRPGE